MRKIKEVFRLRCGEKMTLRAVAQSVGISSSTVSDCLARGQAAGIGWPLPPDVDDGALEALLYPERRRHGKKLAEPDWGSVHKELKRKHVTRMLLWQEYKAAHPDDGYQYSQFCGRYSAFRKKLDVVQRQDHRAGEKMFVDFSGDGVAITDPRTGEVRQAPLFVAALGASGFAYVEAVASEELRNWVAGHISAFEYFGGVTTITVPDQCRTAVKRPCWYDPELNRTYRDLAEHYGTAIIPARPRKPRDKAKVENAVLLAQRWILAALRNHVFFSVEQANEAIWEKLQAYNDRKYQKLDVNRRQLWETLDRPALRPLPPQRYQYADWHSPRVNIDYHVDVAGHYYSVPFALVGEKLEARATAMTVEIFFKGKRVASHPRSYQKGQHSTQKEHMPASHRQHAEWTPSRIVSWAQKSGPHTANLIETILKARRHPEQGYRACLGILRLGKTYGQQRLERACQRALLVGAHSYRSVASILKTGLDHKPLEEAQAPQTPIEHENIRGPNTYH